MVYNAMKLFMEVNPTLFDDCSQAYADDTQSAVERQQTRESRWERISTMANERDRRNSATRPTFVNHSSSNSTGVAGATTAEGGAQKYSTSGMSVGAATNAAITASSAGSTTGGRGGSRSAPGSSHTGVLRNIQDSTSLKGAAGVASVGGQSQTADRMRGLSLSDERLDSGGAPASAAAQAAAAGDRRSR